MKYIAIFCCFFLFSCTSQSGKAPVYDVKSSQDSLKANKRTGKKAIKRGQKQYTVASGDTLYSIAWRAGMDVNTLIDRNRLKEPYIINKNQVLQLQATETKKGGYSQNSTTNICSGHSCTEKKTSGVVKKPAKEYSRKTVAQKETEKKPPRQEPDNKARVKWRWPSKGKITKTFANSVQGMQGISISDKRGTPVYAAAEGKVVYAGNGLRGYGNLIIIKHNNDYLSAYAHNDALKTQENAEVKSGQQIATMGDTGVESVRLHFDIRYRGKSVDPLRYLPKR